MKKLLLFASILYIISSASIVTTPTKSNWPSTNKVSPKTVAQTMPAQIINKTTQTVTIQFYTAKNKAAQKPINIASGQSTSILPIAVSIQISVNGTIVIPITAITPSTPYAITHIKKAWHLQPIQNPQS